MEQEIQYLGENLLPGQLGKLFIFLAFVSALSATIAYAISTMQKDEKESQSWRDLGRAFFAAHSIGVLGIIASLFYIISNFMFEYRYAWEHASLDLPARYLLSCFWEGQEGSFLLWMFWHAVIGILLIFTAKKWESPVMAVVAVVQMFLASMLLGLQLGDLHVGSNPFLLLRETMSAPIFSNPNYLEFIADGTGLNPLLQNYWMTIHPPTLFLGFALTLVPFAFAIASIWKQDFESWVQPALVWTIAATAILGVGILMGALWAYEALTFGGFWAWDPVENASLVPWLTLVAGLHTLLIYKFTRHGLRFTYILFFLTFLLVLYSTFLTRSGILGETSVHAFTDLGMFWQLIAFLMFFSVLAVGFFVWGWATGPGNDKEEAMASREFWMFVGALVFTFSAILITFSTSIPVFNAVLGTDMAPPTEPVMHYNKRQVWIATLIGLFSAMIQYLRYKRSDVGKFVKALILPVLLALGLTILAVLAFEIVSINYLLMFFACSFAVTANLQYILVVVRNKILNWGGSLAHVGFGMLLLGVLISNHNKEVISINNEVSFGDALNEEQTRNNILLIKGQPKKMGDYEVTYVGDTVDGFYTYFDVHYKRLAEDGSVIDEFTLHPNVHINPQMGNVANPSTKKYPGKDIYTHITSLPIRDGSEETPDTMYRVTVSPGDTFYLARAYAILEKGANPNPQNPRYEKEEGDIAAGIRINMKTLDDEEYVAEPVYIIRGTRIESVEDMVEELGVEIRVIQILPEQDQIVLGVAEKEPQEDFIIMQAIVFPQINLVWIGATLCVLGFLFSTIHRISEGKRKAAREKA